MDLHQLQREVGEWAEKNFGKQIPTRPFLGVVEEVGELSHALLKKDQGIRGTAEEHDAGICDAVGDIMIYLADFCYRSGISLAGSVNKAWLEVRDRDWKKFPKNGKTL